LIVCSPSPNIPIIYFKEWINEDRVPLFASIIAHRPACQTTGFCASVRVLAQDRLLVHLILDKDAVESSKTNDLRPSPGRDGNEDRKSTLDDLRQENVALAEENRKLKMLAEYRSAFLARLAHELRTPLTSILGFAEILLGQEALTEAQRNFCERIQKSAQQLQTNFNQLADLSRLEGGQSQLQREEFSIEDILRESCASLARQAEKQRVELRFKAGSDLPMITSDRGKLRQVLYNFLVYAINRSPEGAFVEIAADKAERGFLLTIEDQGELLGENVQVGEWDATDRKAGNSELGLAIAKHNMELIDATLSWQSRRPTGLQILIELPTVVLQKESSAGFT
jgi:signal transduction histidine kinase